ncbi:hypothetical protein ACP4OV_003929 [Aristida adscensionis]
MAITPAYHVGEEELMNLRSLAEEDAEADQDYKSMEESFRVLLRKASELENEEAPSPWTLVWAEDLEEDAQHAAATMADQAEGIRRGVAVLELRPGEEVVVETLRRHTALAGARRAEAAEVVAVVRRLQEKELRRLAAQEHLADQLVPDFLEDVAQMLGASPPPSTPGKLALAALAEGPAVETQEMNARLAGSLRRGAAAFAARPGEEALVAALQRQADCADAARATVEAFTASVRRTRAAGSSPPGGGGALSDVSVSAPSI